MMKVYTNSNLIWTGPRAYFASDLENLFLSSFCGFFKFNCFIFEILYIKYICFLIHKIFLKNTFDYETKIYNSF